MGHYLRDQLISNVSITEESLIQLSSIFEERDKVLNEIANATKNPDDECIIMYVIRFDNKGYRVFTIDDLLRYFRQAKSVERILITVETAKSLRSNRQTGCFMELRLDEKEPQTSFLNVTSDDKDWVDASFSAVLEVLVKYHHRNGWVRTAWTTFGVQLVGVTLGFLLSLWAATKLAPKLAIENAFILSFLFVLLIFSNTWIYLNQTILRVMNIAFPNIKFFRRDKERLHWLLQAVVGGVVGAAVLYFLSQAGAFLIEILGTLVSKNA